MCDWREDYDDFDSWCREPSLYRISRRQGDTDLSSCARHLGFLVLTPGVVWPLQITWDDYDDAEPPESLRFTDPWRWGYLEGLVTTNYWATYQARRTDARR